MKVQLATKIDAEVKASLDEVLARVGVTLSRFVESAILDKLEELEDLSDVADRKKETSKSLKQVMTELKKSGKL